MAPPRFNELGNFLKKLKDEHGKPFADNVYYQPPANVCMSYPAFVYELSSVNSRKANNSIYLHKHRYKVTYISREIREDIIDTMINLLYCSFSTTFISDGLYHYVFEIYI